MAISIQLRIDDQEVEDLLAYLRSRHPSVWSSDLISIMDRATRVLRIVDDYRPNEAPFHAKTIFLADESPIDKHL
jgi:hypothetical protein